MSRFALLDDGGVVTTTSEAHSAASMTAFGLGLGSFAMALWSLFVLSFGPAIAPESGPVVPSPLAVPGTALAAVIVGAVAIVRATRCHERRWMAATGLALGVVVLAACGWLIVGLWISFSGL